MRESLDLTLGVPLYNSARWLPNLLGSLVAQSALPSEIIFLDDASPDDSRSIVEGFKRENPDWNIRIDANAINLGVGGAYNRLALSATRRWTQIMDADDYFVGDFYGAVKDHLLKNAAAVATGMRSNISAISMVNVLFAWLVPVNLPPFLPMLGTLAARGGTIYRTDLLKSNLFINPIFDGSDLLHFFDFRQLGSCIYEPKAKVFYTNHAGSYTNRSTDETYAGILRQSGNIPWTYYVDYLLRKKVFGFIRR